MRSKLVCTYLTYLSGHFKPPSQISVETVIAGRRGTRPFGSTRPFLDVVGPMESGEKRLLMLRIHIREISKISSRPPASWEDTLLNAICPAIYLCSSNPRRHPQEYSEQVEQEGRERPWELSSSRSSQALKLLQGLRGLQVLLACPMLLLIGCYCFFKRFKRTNCKPMKSVKKVSWQLQPIDSPFKNSAKFKTANNLLGIDLESFFLTHTQQSCNRASREQSRLEDGWKRWNVGIDFEL